MSLTFIGWATQIGDWVVDPVKYPNGLKPLVDKAHSHGIKVGLHLPISQVCLFSSLLKLSGRYASTSASKVS